MMLDGVRTDVRECGDDDVVAGRGPGQRGWYEWISQRVSGQSVLDAGCGLGYGLEILATSAREVHGQDVDPRLKRPNVQIKPLAAFEPRSMDVVVSVDVIEHIQDDCAFLADLVRISRNRVILTTPNWTAGRAAWPYHVREYTPAQLRTLCLKFGPVEMWKGTPDGTSVNRIKHPWANDLANSARVSPYWGQGMRALNVALPVRAKIHSHLAAIIDTRQPHRRPVTG